MNTHTPTANSTIPMSIALSFATPRVSVAGTALTRAAADLWRVLDSRGRVIGHIQAVADPLGLRYRARRYHAATGRFRDLGDFWAADDAVGCLRAA